MRRSGALPRAVSLGELLKPITTEPLEVSNRTSICVRRVPRARCGRKVPTNTPDFACEFKIK